MSAMGHAIRRLLGLQEGCAKPPQSNLGCGRSQGSTPPIRGALTGLWSYPNWIFISKMV